MGKKQSIILLSILLILLLGRPLPTRAQANTIRFERLSLEEGLSHSVVSAVVQDQLGFMWFGTEDGLNKYDGYEFTVYKHDIDDPNTLSHNEIRALLVDSNGTLWIGTGAGLDRFDAENQRFVHYREAAEDPTSLSGSAVSALYEDSSGTLWVGTVSGGLNRFDRERETFTRFLPDPAEPLSLSDHHVYAILEDRQGNLWVGTDGGLDLFQPEKRNFAHYRHNPDDASTLSDNRVRTLFEDRLGYLWVGTAGGGLSRLDYSRTHFTQFRHDPYQWDSLSSDMVWDVLEDSSGRLWVATEGGLEQMDRQQNRFTHFRRDPADVRSLSSNAVRVLYEDRSGVLWVGTYSGGLSKLTYTADQFTLFRHSPNLRNSLSDNMVWAICEDDHGSLWVGTFQGGLNRIERRTGIVTVFRHDPADPTSLSHDDVRAILADSQGFLWVGTNGGGLNRFDRETGGFLRYRHSPLDPGSLSSASVSVLYEDSRGGLWVGTNGGGLNRLDRGSDSFIRYQHNAADPTSLSSDQVTTVFEDSSGALWVGTSAGLNVWQGEGAGFHRYRHDPANPTSLSSDQALTIYEDGQGHIWVGTLGGGLNRLNRETGTFTHYTEKDGLPNNTVYGILADNVGNLWLSTNNGLSRFNPSEATFENFTVQDGLQNNEFNMGAYATNRFGEMFFGGIDGLNAFYPQQIRNNETPPALVITSVETLDSTVRTNLSAGDPMVEEPIRLSYRDRFISFDFAALDYNAPQENRYAYILEGFDEDWIDAGTRHHVNYTNLDGGHYTFRVRAANSDGVWNEQGVAVPLVVTPPLWENWWFRGTAGLLLVLLLAGGYAVRMRSIAHQRRELEEQVRERTREIEQRRLVAESLRDILSVLNSNEPLEEVLDYIVQQAAQVLGSDAGVIYRYEGGEDSAPRLHVVASHGCPAGLLALEPVLLTPDGPLSAAAVHRLQDPFLVQDLPTYLARALASPHTTAGEDEDNHQRRDWLQALADAYRAYLAVPLLVAGEPYGVLGLYYTTPRHLSTEAQQLAATFATHVALAIENARLREQAEESAVAEERNRLARDLHDAVTQTLFSASLIADVLPRLWEKDETQGELRLAELRDLTRGALAEMRTLLLELRPAKLTESTLEELLEQLAAAAIGRARLPVELHIDGEPRPLPPDVQIALYRIAQESLNNVTKHARPETVAMSLAFEPSSVRLCVRDDGRGFDPAKRSPNSLGLGIMRERAQKIDADLTIESAPGEGTQVTAIWQDTGEQ